MYYYLTADETGCLFVNVAATGWGTVEEALMHCNLVTDSCHTK